MSDSDSSDILRQGLPEPLQAILPKIDRANEQIQELNSEINVWVNSNPSEFELDVQDDGAKHLVWCQFDPLPDMARWGVIVGDILHNLRSGLDHLAWKLVEASGGTPGRHTEFPIFEDASGWQTASSRRVRGMREPIVAAIDKLQPYHPGNGDHLSRLWIIHDLNRRDKHRLITPVVLCPTEGDYVVSPAASVSHESTLEHKAVFMIIEPREPTPKVHVNFNLTAQVAIDLGGGVRREVGELMVGLRDEFAGVIGKMRPFFD